MISDGRLRQKDAEAFYPVIIDLIIRRKGIRVSEFIISRFFLRSELNIGIFVKPGKGGSVFGAFYIISCIVFPGSCQRSEMLFSPSETDKFRTGASGISFFVSRIKMAVSTLKKGEPEAAYIR